MMKTSLQSILTIQICIALTGCASLIPSRTPSSTPQQSSVKDLVVKADGRSCPIAMSDVDPLVSAIRHQLLKLFRAQDRILNSNILQGWLIASNTVIDIDPAAGKPVVRIIGNPEMPLKAAPSFQAVNAKVVDVHGLKGLEFFADTDVGVLIRDMKCYTPDPGEFPETIVQLSSTFQKYVADKKSMDFAADPTHEGLGLIFKMENPETDAADSINSPAACGHVEDGEAWQISGHVCFSINGDTDILPCAYYSPETQETFENPDGSVQSVFTAVTATGETWWEYNCALTGDDDIRIAGQIILAFPPFTQDQSTPPPNEPCALGDPGCNGADLMAPFLHH